MASTTTPFRLRAMAILWPAFLMAGVLEILVFALVDPGTLHWFGGTPVELSATAVYTLAYFVFWGVMAITGALTHLLDLRADELNEPDSPASQPQRGPGWPR